MSTRLQVLLDEVELEKMREHAVRQGMTLSEWVRQTLRQAMRLQPAPDIDKKLECVRAAMRHRFPTADIDQMLSEIEQGYGSGP
jgi:hypothetical protein